MTNPSLVLVGAGLASGLIALRLSGLAEAPAIDIVEASDRPFGEHTWSFHAADVSADDLEWLAGAVAHSWSGQAIRFPAFERRLASAYASITSVSMSEAVARLGNVRIRTGAAVERPEPGQVRLGDGQILRSGCVVDARGFAPNAALELGFQKFVGLEVECASPHGVDLPQIMDATVDQLDGYRFVYLLPFSPTRLLIEDTRYTDGAALDPAALRRDILAYAAVRGWVVAEVLREETGVLPISLAHDAAAFWVERPLEVPQVGMRAALFHPTTGYSLPDAVRVANLIAAHWPIESAPLAAILRRYSLKQVARQRFYRLLNRMLFRAAEPAERVRVLQRFYRLPRPLIERFYAGRTSFADACRILIGKPPVRISRALGCLFEHQVRRPRETT
ncbi:MAG: lycopene beta-cyclase CrtY [Devosia sp.]|nr:lycopene beta-cyclase CrtY [Devosia sp.]